MKSFSIRSLMAVILVSAVGLAALRNTNDQREGMLLLVALCSGGYLAVEIKKCRKTA
jgi:hypothetical protein